MKNILCIVSVTLVAFNLIGQEPFEDNGKWGVSEYGDGGKTDSIIVPAVYDEIKIIYDSPHGNVYLGKENKLWKVLSSNLSISQERYDEVFLDVDFDRFLQCSRDGELDLIDLKNNEFLIRGIQAESLSDHYGLLTVFEERMLMVENDGHYGLIHIPSKILIVQPEYDYIKSNNLGIDKAPILLFKKDVNYVIDTTGKELFKISFDQRIEEIEPTSDCEKCYHLHIYSKKGGHGFYDAKNDWLIPPVYNLVEELLEVPDVLLTLGKKGWGIFYQGKEVLKPKYERAEKSDKEGYVLKVYIKGETFYLSPSGELVQL